MSPEDPAPEETPPPAAKLDRQTTEGREIERKFLVTALPDDVLAHPSERIAQGYLAVDPEGAEVRLRRRGFHTLLTIKLGHGLTRGEEEFLIDGPRFDRLWRGTEARQIEKVRYAVPAEGDDGRVIEVDVFGGSLTGLVVAEVEFDSEADAAAFRPPSWLRPEVTGDPRYANARLAVDGAPDRKAVGEHALLDGEAVQDGVIHVALAQIDAAADALQGRDAQEYGKAVHTARKAFKRARALVRIARDGLGEEVARRDGDALRDAGRRLAGARDAQVMVETLDAIVGRYPDDLDPQRVGPLRAQLVAAFEEADREARADAGAADDVLAILGTVRADVEAWSLGDDPAEVLAAGLERIIRHGRRRLKLVRRDATEPGTLDTDLLHELRKRAKDLWHASELVEIAAPKRFRGLADEAHTLADHIGDDHDLAVLAEQIEARPDAFEEPADAALLHDLIAKRRKKLQRKALTLAEEIYGRKASRYVERVQELGER